MHLNATWYPCQVDVRVHKFTMKPETRWLFFPGLLHVPKFTRQWSRPPEIYLASQNSSCIRWLLISEPALFHLTSESSVISSMICGPNTQWVIAAMLWWVDELTRVWLHPPGSNNDRRKIVPACDSSEIGRPSVYAPHSVMCLRMWRRSRRSCMRWSKWE